MNNKQSKLFYAIILIISAVIICCFKYLAQYTCFWGDDFFFARYNSYETYFYCMKMSSFHGGGYIGLFLCKFISFGLPVLLNIHPNDFLCCQANIIRGGFACITLLIFSRFTVFLNKSKLIYSCAYLFTASYFFFYALKSNVIIVNYNYYRYFFSLLFLGIFLLYLYKNLTEKSEKTNYLKLITATICGFIAGTSVEINIFLTSFFIGLIILCNIFFKKNRFHTDINFYIPSAGLYSAMILFTTSAQFKNIASERGMAHIQITFDMLKEYLHLYYKVCVREEFIYWIIFTVLLIICIKYAIQRKETNKIIFPILLQISIHTVMFSLILCGKTFTDCPSPRFYLYHHNIVFLYRMLLLFPIFLLTDYSLNIRNTKQTKILTAAIFIILGFIYTIYSLQLSDFYVNLLKEAKKQQYMYEKIIRYYHLQNKTAKVPDFFVQQYIELNMEKFHKPILIHSMDLTYKDKIASQLGYRIIPDGLEVYYKDGGTFSDEELNKIKFSRLLDNDFVLNKH